MVQKRAIQTRQEAGYQPVDASIRHRWQRTSERVGA